MCVFFHHNRAFHSKFHCSHNILPSIAIRLDSRVDPDADDADGQRVAWLFSGDGVVAHDAVRMTSWSLSSSLPSASLMLANWSLLRLSVPVARDAIPSRLPKDLEEEEDGRIIDGR